MGSVIKTLAEGGPIRGVATLDIRLFVLRGPKTSKQLEIYDVNSFSLLHCLTVPGLANAADIAACKHNCCIYICDGSSQNVYRMSSTDYDKLTQWSVNDGPTSLSITVKYSVLVTCRKVRTVKQFTTDGQLLREVVLRVFSPWHTVQLSGGDLVVCHGHANEPLHRVCLMNCDMQVVKSFCKEYEGSQINTPCHMAVDEKGSVFVVDQNNCTVLLLSPTLRTVCKVISRDKLELTPYRLSLDIQHRRLYIAVNEHRKVGDYTAELLLSTCILASDKDKAEALCDFFKCSLFNEPSDDFAALLPSCILVVDTVGLVLTFNSVLSTLAKIKVYKSAQLECIYPRVGMNYDTKYQHCYFKSFSILLKVRFCHLTGNGQMGKRVN